MAYGDGQSAESDLGLGIDTGGTFTDAAIVDLGTRKVLRKAKAPTTYHDLSVGINAALRDLRESGGGFGNVRLVGISTTLATNSILQGKGGEVGLIGIGWTPREEWDFGCRNAAFIKGGCDSYGGILERMDEGEAVEAIETVRKGVDAIAVSGLFSVCNTSQESKVRSLIAERTPLPVVLGNSLTGDLGIMERTVTAVLNAKLIPIIASFLDSVEASLAEQGVEAEIYVLKGDGGLMSLGSARERPVETILSGPAASLMGGRELAGVESCMVVDIGGTSTDIAILEDGFPRLTEEGAAVGNWRTRVKAIDMWTAGLGGDSGITFDEGGEVIVGPERVLPLSMAGRMRRDMVERIRTEGVLTFYVSSVNDPSRMSEEERLVLDFVRKEGPVSLFGVMDGVKGVVLVRDRLESLRSRGYVLRTGLTPTDAMHFLGMYAAGDREAAAEGIRLMAEKVDMRPEEFARSILERVTTRVGEEVIKKLAVDSGGEALQEKGSKLLLRACAGEDVLKGMMIRPALGTPLVGIGAPAHIFVKGLENRFNTEIIVPRDYDVGNAVGAVCSRVSESVSVRVYPKEDKFVVFAPSSSPVEYSHVETARESAIASARRDAVEKVQASGAEEIRVKIDTSEVRFHDGYGKEMRFINWISVKATATGRPRLRKRR